jgi:hypothetical protein
MDLVYSNGTHPVGLPSTQEDLDLQYPLPCEKFITRPYSNGSNYTTTLQMKPRLQTCVNVLRLLELRLIHSGLGRGSTRKNIVHL